MKKYQNYKLVYKNEVMTEEELVSFIKNIGFDEDRINNVIDVLKKVGAIKEL